MQLLGQMSEFAIEGLDGDRYLITDISALHAYGLFNQTEITNIEYIQPHQEKVVTVDEAVQATGDASQISYAPSDESDVLRGNEQGNVIYAKAGNDYLAGNGGHDLLYGEAGLDYLLGGDGNDHIFGGDDKDRLKGGNGSDFLQGNRGNDLLRGENSNDTLRGGKDRDSLDGGEGDDWCAGDKGTDFVYGGEGNDTLRGGKDNDTIRGDAGDDVILGDKGDDKLTGGDGADSFVFHQESGKDTIIDFVSGEDKLMLSKALFETPAEAMESYVSHGLTLGNGNYYSYILLGEGNSVRVYNAEISEADISII